MQQVNVLLVEDSDFDALLIERALKNAGFVVSCTRVDTPEGLSATLRHGSFDVVIADYNLPRFSGVDALKLVRDLRPELPVIIASGTVGEEAAVAIIKAGASDFVLKSRLSRLAPIFERELRESAMRQTHRQMHIELLDSQGHFNTFMNNSPMIAYIKDRDGKLIYVNTTFERVFQASSNELLGRLLSDVWSEEYSEDYELTDQVVFDTNKPVETVKTVRQGDGLHHWLVTKFPVPKMEGPALIGAIGVDITGRKRLEKQLQQKLKMEAIGHLAGGVAHDFNNLLTIIMGRSALLLTRLEKTDPHFREIDMIRTTAERAAGLTRQLLQFSRQQVLQPKVLNVNDIINEISEMLRRLIGEHIELVLSLDPELPWVRVDPSQLQQIILNLSVNARDAMPGGGRLVIETQPVDLDEEYATRHESVKAGRHVSLSFSDTGCGMDEATRARLFEPFFTTKEVGKGTGLGLSTVYGIVKQSGGSIWVYSEPERGSTFKIYLPVASETSLSARSSGALPSVSTKAETVLLVEDDVAVRELVTEVLRSAGYQLLIALDGEEALKVGTDYKDVVHLLLTDVVMPRMGGDALAEQLLVVRPEMKVLYMSGYASHTLTDQKGLQPGQFYIDKPFTPLQLLRRVRDVLTEPTE